MRRILTRIALGVAVSGVAALLLLFALTAFGIVSVGISPIYHYRLTEAETALLDAAHTTLHARIANGQFDLIHSDLVEARVRKDENIQEMKKARETFGAPHSFEFFRAAVPESASKYYSDQQGTNYITYYFTKGDNSEFFEDIDWIVDDSGRARVRNYSATEIVEWQKKNREREKELDRELPNELRIPAFGYLIEIRY